MDFLGHAPPTTARQVGGLAPGSIPDICVPLSNAMNELVGFIPCLPYFLVGIYMQFHEEIITVISWTTNKEHGL